MIRFSHLLCLLAGVFLCSCEQFSEAWEDAFTPPNQKKKSDSTSVVNDYDPATKDKRFEQEKEFEYVLSFHRIPDNPEMPDMIAAPVQRAGSLEPIVVESNLFCHSRDIDEIKIVPSPTRPNFYGLALHLDKKGRKRWMSMSTAASGQPLAMLVDKEFYKAFTIEKVFNSEYDEWAYVNINLSERVAKKISNAAKKNYKYFNQKPTDFWKL